jgi:serine/threonine protein kinase
MTYWPHDSDIVQSRTVFMIMPRYPFTLLQLIRFRSSLHGSPSPHGDAFHLLLTENEIVHISTQLCNVLLHIHNNKVVHRDLKPDNVLIDIPYLPLLPLLLSSDSLITLMIISYVGLHECHVILGDFGEALDFRDSGLKDFKVPYPLDGVSKGGAQIALAPEIFETKAGQKVILDYGMNDAYALGRVIWHMMFTIEPSSRSDSDWLTVSSIAFQHYSVDVRMLVASLLISEPTLRLTLNEAMRSLNRLNNRKMGHCLTCNHHHHPHPPPSPDAVSMTRLHTIPRSMSNLVFVSPIVIIMPTMCESFWIFQSSHSVSNM